MVSLEFTYKDAFKSARLGFSPKKMWILFEGIFLAVLGYSIITYLAYLSSGWGIKEIWQQYRYIPLPIFNSHLKWYGWLIWILGDLYAFYIYAVSFTAVSKVTFEQLRGDEFYEIKEAWRFARKNWKGAFLSPIYLIFFIALLVFTGMLFGLVGRIPHVGQILISLLGIPLFAGAFFIVYLTVVLFVTFTIAPAVVATTESDTFDTLFESFSVINDQTWRFILWEFILGIVAFLGVLIFGVFMKYALHLTKWAIGFWQGPRGWWNIMWNNAHWYLYVSWLPVEIGKYFPSLITPFKFVSAGNAGAVTSFGGFLLGLIFYTIVFTVVSYGLSIWSAGQTIIYTVLVKLKDEKNLLEKKEESFEEEALEQEKEKEVSQPESSTQPEETSKKKVARKKPTVKKATTRGKKTTAKKSPAKTKTKKKV